MNITKKTYIVPSVLIGLLAISIVAVLAPTAVLGQGVEPVQKVVVSCTEGREGAIITITNLRTGQIMSHRTGAPQCPPGLSQYDQQGTLTCSVVADLTTLTVETETNTYNFVVPTSTVPDGFC